MKNQLFDLLGRENVQENVDLFPHLSMRLHTIAEHYFELKSQADFVHAIKAANALNIPLIFLGGGSNAVFGTPLVKGLVVKNKYTSINVIAENETYADVEVGSGTDMAILVQKLAEKGLSGLEYHKGLPGTVGGAVYMNSKWSHPQSAVGDCVISAILIDKTGGERRVEKEYFAFAYDYSILQKTHEVVASVVFRLQKKNKKVIEEQANESLAYRKKTQPTGIATCGCFFRNISASEQKAHGLPTRSAGYLIDQAGMKGARVGSFQVSSVHANFITNTGGDARPEDLIQLASLIKRKVKEKSGVELIEEVQIL